MCALQMSREARMVQNITIFDIWKGDQFEVVWEQGRFKKWSLLGVSKVFSTESALLNTF